MDDTRDIAIKASASAAAAHHRLDGYNGQIARLARAVEGTNVKLDDAVNHPEHGLRVELGQLRADMRVHAAKLTLMVSLIGIIVGATVSTVASHFFQQHPAAPPAQTADAGR
jgi:hypothetical protein